MCGFPTDSLKMPRRLVQIRASENPRLIYPEERCKYLALSFVWGESRQGLTLKSNLQSRVSEIPTTELPLHFQDAIDVCKWSGILYLWIDSLCIVQDDEDDMQAELGKMADIYKGAIMVIGAACQADAREGFIYDRSPHFQLELKLQSGETLPIHCRRAIQHGYTNKDLPDQLLDEILFTRAWCFQERSLAARILYFGRRELVFQCRSGQDCECGFEKVLEASEKRFWNNNSTYHPTNIAQLISGKQDEFSYFEFAGLWMEMVTIYSALNITVAEDLLPALGGLAASISQLKPGLYLAGHWEYGIIHQLMWKADQKKTRVVKYASESKRMLPSFSWASCSRPVDWWPCVGIQHVATASFIGGSCPPKAAVNPFGEVLGGWIKLSGKLVSASIVLATSIWNDTWESLFKVPSEVDRMSGLAAGNNLLFLDPDVSVGPSVIFDDKNGRERNWAGIGFFAMLQSGGAKIGQHPSSSESSEFSQVNPFERSVSGLILEQHPDSSDYRRIGIFQELPNKHFGPSIPQQYVTIT